MRGCSGGRPGGAFNNMVSARWRRRTGQGACLIKHGLLLFNISVDNSVERSRQARYTCMDAWQSTLDNNGQRVGDKHGFDAINSMHGGLMCMQTLASFY